MKRSARLTLAVGISLWFPLATTVHTQDDFSAVFPKWDARRLTLPAYRYALSHTNVSRADGIVGMNYFYLLTAADPEVRKVLFFVENAHITGASGGHRSIEYGEGVFRRVVEGRYDDAMGDLEYALTRVPNHPDALQLVGVIARLTGRRAVAVDAFERALAKYPEYGMTYFQYARYLVEGGLTQEAKSVVERGLHAEADYEPLRRLLTGLVVKPRQSR